MSFVATDLPSRIEERYIVFSRDQSIEDSLPNMKRIKFSDNEDVQTHF